MIPAFPAGAWSNSISSSVHSATKRGFTLIELLVAISILGIIAVLGWRGLDSIVRARIALTADLEQTRGMQLAFAQLQSDCGLIADAAMMPNRTNLLWQSDNLILARKVYAENQPTSLQVVTYRLRDGALKRSESVATRDLSQLAQLWQSALADTDGANAVTLKSGIDAMSVLSWDGAAWTALVAPVKDNGTAASPMSGIQVTLQLREQKVSLVKAFLLGTT